MPKLSQNTAGNLSYDSVIERVPWLIMANEKGKAVFGRRTAFNFLTTARSRDMGIEQYANFGWFFKWNSTFPEDSFGNCHPWQPSTEMLLFFACFSFETESWIFSLPFGRFSWSQHAKNMRHGIFRTRTTFIRVRIICNASRFTACEFHVLRISSSSGNKGLNGAANWIS